jgi:hypothetical protein
MTSDAESLAARQPALGELLQNSPDEFDLDIRWGELDQAGAWVSYLPTANEVPGETCDTHAATCPATCQATCPDTCRATCQFTCPDTCGGTCAGDDTCLATCANTRCFTCPQNCVPP